MLLHQFMNGALDVMHPSPLQKDTTFTKIFVGGLPYHTNDASLRKYFEAFGDIDEAVVITDRQTGKSRGYGFVSTDETAPHPSHPPRAQHTALVHNFDHKPHHKFLICCKSAPQLSPVLLPSLVLVFNFRLNIQMTCISCM